ncbi:hypothetical protein [Salinigranum rubrum]|uniref:hypothetical protein n=1 Tax=Salinigranum rubrum TaxID=755307 RepID=UPI001FEC4690|nr:hypothetical protein [Salinigranum rubrum]
MSKTLGTAIPTTGVGFARHWQGGTMRLNFDLFSEPEASDPVVVVTTIAGREGNITVDGDFGEIELPDQVPTEQE